MRSRPLRVELVAGVVEHVVGLGREPDQHLSGALRSAEVDEEVVGLLEDDRRDVGALLDLVVGRVGRSEVGDRRSHDDHVELARSRHDRGLHVGRARDANDLDARRAPGGRRS